MMNRAGRYRGVSKLHYEIRGTKGPRVVFVMGLGMQGLAWAPQRDMLQAECQTLIYDHPGIGQSLRSGRHLHLEDHADDLGFASKDARLDRLSCSGGLDGRDGHSGLGWPTH